MMFLGICLSSNFNLFNKIARLVSYDDNFKGNTYGEKTIAQLANFLPKIDKAILEASDVEVRQSLEMRRNAILTILNAEKEARGLDLKMEKFF